MARVGWGGWTGVAASLLALAPAGADDTAVMKEIEALKAKIQELERKAADRPVTPGVVPVAAPPQSVVKDPMPTPAAPPSPGAGDAAGQNLEWMKDIKVYGFVDVGFNVNPNNPVNHLNGNTGIAIPPGTSTGGASHRCFDQRANSFTFHNAQIDIERVATMDSIVGFKAEFTTGEDAEVITSPSTTGGGAAADAADIFDVQEAYVQFIVPAGNGVDIKVGKMATLAGYEVIESKDNYNYSRSFMFFYAIPFTHTGIRASYQVFDPVKLTLGLNNGWNQSDDNNGGKTLEFQFALTPTIWDANWLSFYANLYWGAERTQAIAGGNSNGDKRFLVDLNLILTPVENWTFGVNFDFGTDDDAVLTGAAAGGSTRDAKWRGVAGYVKYQLWDWYAIAVRGENYDDQDGFTTGNVQKLFEVTLTNEFKIAERVLLRLEYRHDQSDEDTFLDGSLNDDHQDTLAAEVIFPF